MNCLFSLFACPYCSVASLSIQQANTTLPLNQRIAEVIVMPQEINGKWIGDPRLAFLAELNKTESLQQWGFPVLVLDNDRTKERFGRLIREKTGRIMVHSAYSHNHYVVFLRRYLNN